MFYDYQIVLLFLYPKNHLKQYCLMTRQSKNKVKLNQQYRNIGRLPLGAAKTIKEMMDLPEIVRQIRSNSGNTLKHNHRHADEMEKQLDELGLTKEGYAEYVVNNFNQIRVGNVPKSLVLAIMDKDLGHIAAVRLHYYLNENFWLVTTVHAMKPKDIEKSGLIWEKRKTGQS